MAKVDDGEPEALAFAALGWILSDDDHADRLLALTGVSPEELRERIGERVVLAAILEFVLSHEPDLIACADALGVPPKALEKAHVELAAPMDDADWGA